MTPHRGGYYSDSSVEDFTRTSVGGHYSDHSGKDNTETLLGKMLQ